jgi:RimJ/RimL family protein N-acetyltransferase
MQIETARLLIRDYTLDDLDALAIILGDPTTMRFWPQPLSRAEAAGWIARNQERASEGMYGRRPLVLASSGAIIGDVGVVRSELAGAERNDLGYILHHPYWGQGLASEAAGALRDRAFAVQGLPALHANMAHDHIASQRVAERLGMRRILEFANPRNRGILTYLYELQA